ncbi:hypothetical protein KJ750_01040 [Patescibacteria group bacterium]|nr:hypothetical protein [Patescibacteria group bacterium]
MDVKATVDVGQNTKELLESAGGTVSKLIEELANTLGMTVEKIFPYYIKQAYIKGLTWLISWSIFEIVVLLITLISLKLIFVYDKRDEEDFATAAGIVCIISLIVFVIGVGVGAYNMADWIAMIKNPQYLAIQSLISDAGKLIRK